MGLPKVTKASGFRFDPRNLEGPAIIGRSGHDEACPSIVLGQVVWGSKCRVSHDHQRFIWATLWSISSEVWMDLLLIS